MIVVFKGFAGFSYLFMRKLIDTASTIFQKKNEIDSECKSHDFHQLPTCKRCMMKGIHEPENDRLFYLIKIDSLGQQEISRFILYLKKHTQNRNLRKMNLVSALQG